MTFKQYFPITVMIAMIAFLLMLTDMAFAKVIFAGEGAKNYFAVWIAFQAWAMYFMAGCNIAGGVKVVLGYLGGAAASIAIMELAGVLGFLGLMNVPVAVLIVVVPVICADRVPWFNFVPAWFVGAGVFFGMTTLQGFASKERIALAALEAGKTSVEGMTDASAWTHMDVGIACLLSCIVGCLFGVITILGRAKYEATLNLEAPAEEAAAEAAPAVAEAAPAAPEAPAEDEA